MSYMPQQMDVNRIRQLLASGQITEEQLAQMTLGGSMGGPAPQVPQRNELARVLSEQEQFAQGDTSGRLPMGSMRNEQTGNVTYFKPGGGGYGAQPYPQGGGAPARPKMRVVGYGNGQATDLGEEEARAMPIDMTRPAVDIPGVGKGRYTADGRSAIVTNADGTQTKVILGYDREASDRGRLRELKFRGEELDNQAREEQIAAMRDRRAMLAAGPSQTATDASPGLIPGAGIPQTVLEKQYGKAPPNKRWTQDGKLEDLPGDSLKATDAKDVITILDMAEPLLDQSTGSYGGFAIDKLAQVFGHATEGAKAGASLKALQGTLVSKMPKMSGPQSDKDVLLYKQMAGEIGDPTIPADQKRAAMATIRRLNQQYAGVEAAPNAAPAAPESKPQAAPKVGTMKQGRGGATYTFTGGDQYDAKNWRRVQ